MNTQCKSCFSGHINTSACSINVMDTLIGSNHLTGPSHPKMSQSYMLKSYKDSDSGGTGNSKVHSAGAWGDTISRVA